MDTIVGNIVDVVAKKIFFGELTVDEGFIQSIKELGPVNTESNFILPGLVDAHVHIESSMLVPEEFARAALRHGVIASVSDPHEIANVLGMQGIEFMYQHSLNLPFTILLGAPSCVPATPFETSGATLSAEDIDTLIQTGRCGYLSEVMNFPAVLSNQSDVIAKINIAKHYGIPIDGHAPGLLGEEAALYASKGISTDHECKTLNEALDKIKAGMHILIREGSAAKDFDALSPLLASHPDRVMFCSDDKHPDDLLNGHINELVVRALRNGHDLFSVLRAASFNAIKHYDLKLGLLQVGDRFDAIEVDNFNDFRIQNVWVKGQKVASEGQCDLTYPPIEKLNYFKATQVFESSLLIKHPGCSCRVIDICDGQLWTKQIIANVPNKDSFIEADLHEDILFLAVMNRYASAPPSIALIRGFGLKGNNSLGGAIASSVAHDSHNIVAVGTSAQWLSKAINHVIDLQGGMVAIDSVGMESLPLPIAGIMSDQSLEKVASTYQALNKKAVQMGSKLNAPFMTLSFMALLVIPELKLSDKGLFDATKFNFCSLGIDHNEIERNEIIL